MKRGTSLITPLLEVLSPQRCMLCGQLLYGAAAPARGLCSGCYRRLTKERLRGERCRMCGRPLISSRQECLYCREKQFSFDSHFSLFMYQGVAKGLLQAYKFGNHRQIGYVWAHFTARSLYGSYWDYTIVPVPGRKNSVRRRGWDQMLVIARILQRKYGLKTEFLLNRKGGVSQKFLSYEGRMANLKGRIGVKNLPIPEKVLLIDDVFTTGASLSECAAVIKNRGAAKVSALSLTRAPY